MTGTGKGYHPGRRHDRLRSVCSCPAWIEAQCPLLAESGQ